MGLLTSPSSEAVRTALPLPAPTCTSLLCFCGSSTQKVLKLAHPSRPRCSLGSLPLTWTVVCPTPWVHLLLCSESDLLGTQEHAPEGSLSSPTPSWPSGSGEVRPVAIAQLSCPFLTSAVSTLGSPCPSAWLPLCGVLLPCLPSLPLLFLLSDYLMWTSAFRTYLVCSLRD